MQKVLIGYQGPSGFVASAGVNSPYRSIDLGITGQVVKGSPGVLKTVHAMNQAASARYVKVYNKATAPLAADTPVFTIAIPAGGSVTFSPSEGVDFSAGIGLRASNLIADSDATAPTANDVLVNVSYR